jgi:lipoprotein-anchoring transpeptidase ErfK/SrfK
VARRDRGALVARVRPGRVIAVRSAPDGAVVARLSARTEFGSPRTFAVTRELPGRKYAVITTALPNGRTGWIEAGLRALSLTRTRVTLDVDLSARLLRVRNGGRVIRRIRVGTGAPASPTPAGRFAITDKLRGANYSSAYGCCILALSGHQTNLPRGWTGGDRLAIHGGSTAGAVSSGCLHAATVDLVYLMRSVSLGALVVIHP